jgi:hypothetical protein
VGAKHGTPVSSSEVRVTVGLGRNSKSMRMRIAAVPYPAFLLLAGWPERVAELTARSAHYCPLRYWLSLALFCLFSIACACRRSSSQGAYRRCNGLSCLLPLT